MRIVVIEDDGRSAAYDCEDYFLAMRRGKEAKYDTNFSTSEVAELAYITDTMAKVRSKELVDTMFQLEPDEEAVKNPIGSKAAMQKFISDFSKQYGKNIGICEVTPKPGESLQDAIIRTMEEVKEKTNPKGIGDIKPGAFGTYNLPLLNFDEMKKRREQEGKDNNGDSI